jgi:hypothetical protein
MSAQLSHLREFAQLIRLHEPGSTNLGSHLNEHADDLAPLLRITPGELRARAHDVDEVLLPGMVRTLESVEGALRSDRERRQTEISLRAAHTIGSTARWTEERAVLDVDLLLTELLTDRKVKYVTFVGEGDDIAVTVYRWMLADVRPLRRVFIDLAAFVDTETLGFRWKGGRGRLNWRSQAVPAGAEASVLTVPLGARRLHQVRGAWLGDVLQELGFPA